MDKIIEIVKLMIAEWEVLIVAILATVGGASAILKIAEKVAVITPWTWDNKVVRFFQKILEIISLKLKK